MTKKFENTPRAKEITTLFQAHEDAVAAYTQAAHDGMENSDPAQFYAVQVTMGEAYRDIVNFLTTPTLPAYEFTTREGFDVGITAEAEFMAALSAYDAASYKHTQAEYAGLPQQDKAQFTVIENAMLAANDHLCEVVEAYAAYMSAQAVSRVALLHKPAPSAASSYLTGQPEFTALFNTHRDAALAFEIASNAHMETTDKAQWQAIETTMGEAYTALMDFIDAHTTRNAAPAPSVAANAPFVLESIADSDSYNAALEAYLLAIQRGQELGCLTFAHPLQKASDAARSACNSALNAAIDAHCAAQVAAGVNALIPAPLRCKRTMPLPQGA